MSPLRVFLSNLNIPYGRQVNMIDINKEIYDLVQYALSKKLLDKRDEVYAINRLLVVLGLSEFKKPENIGSIRELNSILKNMRRWATEEKDMADSIEDLDLFDTEIMTQLIKLPSEIEREFYEHYRSSPVEATEFYYELAQNSNYIRTDRIKKDIRWKHETPYGTLDMTINLSKPEKDPKAIARAKLVKSSTYPKCLLCRENEGYAGTPGHPARGNHRVIGVELSGERWYLQYSPYTYYNEHCIVFCHDHVPMRISRKTFSNLLEFVKKFPHYFVGSNADLPIVGGSILSHDHFQGGNYSFAMERALEYNIVLLKNGVESCLLNWPMSVIRIKGRDTTKLIDTACEIHNRWKMYSDKEALIISHSNGEEHNTITPICRFKDGMYEFDLVLRNNRTTEERPYGLFHPGEEYHHIKKENIGLIEVMGLAVLPSRLKKEIEQLKYYLINKDAEGIKENEELIKHVDWAETLLSKYEFTSENADNILRLEISEVFLKVLKDAGVFKDGPEGRAFFDKCFKLLLENLI